MSFDSITPWCPRVGRQGITSAVTAGATGGGPTVNPAPDFLAAQEAPRDDIEAKEACQNCRPGQRDAGRHQLDIGARVALRARAIPGACRGQADAHLHLHDDAPAHDTSAHDAPAHDTSAHDGPANHDGSANDAPAHDTSASAGRPCANAGDGHSSSDGLKCCKPITVGGRAASPGTPAGSCGGPLPEPFRQRSLPPCSPPR
jgi:hypothetical protein